MLLLASAASFAAAAAQAAPAPVVAGTQRVAQESDPLTLFGDLMPVLTSPRCFNCHGGTDPVTGANHGGGAVGAGADCHACHTASEEWTGVSGIQFTADVKPMCETMRHVVQVIGPTTFVNFVGSDPVVGLGFDGLRGMDENSAFWPIEADPPPDSRADFVAAAQRWVTEGGARCGAGWNGAISMTQRFSSVAPGYDAGEVAEFDIKLVNGQATAHVVDNKHETSDTPAIPGACGSFRHNKGEAVGDVAAGVTISSPSDDEYQITVSVPDNGVAPVMGTWSIDTLNVASCQAGHVTQSEQYPVLATYTVHAKVDPDDPTHLKGAFDDTRSLLKTSVTWELNLEGN